MALRLNIDTNEIAQAARSRGVQRLRVFGSALTDDFDPQRSDVDLLVEFAPGNADAFDSYFGLKEDLERIFARSVDLVMVDAIENPYFKYHAFVDAQDLYAA